MIFIVSCMRENVKACPITASTRSLIEASLSGKKNPYNLTSFVSGEKNAYNSRSNLSLADVLTTN